jgi:hypothetical protein
MTEANVKLLRRCETIYVDGAFKTCPKPYHQVLTVHGMYVNRVLSLTFCLLKGKQVGLYRKVFSKIKTKTRQITGHHLKPKMIVCDFEISLLTAVETEFPRSALRGCYFHFCQSLWRRIQDLHLASAYGRDTSVKKLLRKFLSFGYIPLPLIRIIFNLLFTSRTVRRLMTNNPGITQFVNYFQRNYITGPFPPKLWNVYDRTVDFRTSNHVEGT